MLPWSAFRLLGTRRLRRAWLSLILLSVAACAGPQPLPERPDIPFGQGRLWQVDYAGGPPSYLFGTMHVANPQVLDLPPAVEAAFADSQIAAFEYIGGPDESLLDGTRMNLPEGQTLEQLLGAASFGQLQRILAHQHYSVGAFNGMKPWAVMFFLEQMNGEEILVDLNHPELDTWLEQRAAQDGKRLVGLETVEEQVAIFNEMPAADQIALLKDALDRHDRRRRNVRAVEIYVNGDLAMMYALWHEELAFLNAVTANRYNRRLIVDRNHTMVERMLPLLEEGRAFVAVGSLHMPGEDGILYLLQQRGYRVTRLH